MKSVHSSAPDARRPVPDVRGKASGNGQPAGRGSTGSACVAANGTPGGSPGGGAVGVGAGGDAARAGEPFATGISPKDKPVVTPRTTSALHLVHTIAPPAACGPSSRDPNDRLVWVFGAGRYAPPQIGRNLRHAIDGRE